MIEETEELLCPICDAPLHRQEWKSKTLWECGNCERDWTPDELADEGEYSRHKKPEAPESNFL
jgi:ribosomal protein L37AE/L43A